MGARLSQGRRGAAFGLALAGCSVCAVWFALLGHGGLDDPLLVLLAAFALASNLAAANWDRSLEISGSLIAALIAGAFLGPAAAFALVVVAEGAAWAIERLRPIALPLNAFALGLPALAAAALLRELVEAGAPFYLAFACVAALAGPLNILLVTSIGTLHDGRPLRGLLEQQRSMLPVWAINVALTVAIAAVYETAGLPAAGLILVGVVAFTYQSRLVARAEERTRQYAALSWGVLSGTLRNLDMRDSRTARHCAAVAIFARDIAREGGLDERDQELAHTAGLLHDVGKFALSDRVMERGVRLTDNDWRGIRRHPELGADMLKDLGVYGPIAEIVKAHHERLDGRGYPAGLRAGEIPEIAKIVAVAEVYDTLTADDTYRVRLSSFEALTELRRVSGTQLDGCYVEALARSLEGTGVEYRHAAAADFDRELDMERRISQAASG